LQDAGPQHSGKESKNAHRRALIHLAGINQGLPMDVALNLLVQNNNIQSNFFLLPPELCG
jgi:hypothetical protein